MLKSVFCMLILITEKQTHSVYMNAEQWILLKKEQTNEMHKLIFH